MCVCRSATSAYFVAYFINYFDILSQKKVFGNDFDKILGGVNLLAVADNGQRVVTNLMEALQPILTAGAERCATQTADAAVQKAKARRGEKL